MNTTIDNTQRKFLVQSQGFGNQKDIFCNLHDIPFILSEYFEKHEEYKVFEYWNRRLKLVSKKHLKALYEANQIDGQTVKTIDINCLEWFDKINGNSYFAAKICVNAGLKSEVNTTLKFQYGYGEHYKDEAFKHLENLGVLKGIRKYENGSNEGIVQYCRRRNITMTTRKRENCKKSELKNI